MISDVLSDAVDEIRHYQREWPDNYSPLDPAIKTVCEVMDALRLHLDTPPGPPLREPLHDLQTAIARLDLSVIRAARRKLLEDWRKSGRSSKGTKKDSRCRVDIAILLFCPPWFELQDYDLNGAGLRALAAGLNERLCSAAAVLDKLQADGWLIKVVNSNLEAQHPEVNTHAQAVDRLRRLGIEEGAILDIAEWSALGERLSPP